jgi:TonB-linked SusC/RagA family outer membrane protein
MSASASMRYMQEAKITLNLPHTTVKKALDEVKRQTEFSFWYRDEDIDLDRPVSVVADKQDVRMVLNQILATQDLSYSINDRHIIIYPKTEPGEEQPAVRQQQGRGITGMVVDTNGETIIGANILEKGTANGTVTDADGNFSLTVAANAVLQVSYIGYVTQEVNVLSDINRITIRLVEDSKALEEVIVVGYGFQKRSDLIGSIGSVSEKALAGRATLTVEQALQGKVPGVMVTQRSGQPGATPSVRIRGIGTLNNNDPLYIVDGVPLTNSMEIINNQDIESIEILKDAASASIYGSRAGNGVILITTKKGIAGKPAVFYDGNIGYNEASKRLNLLNTAEFTMIMDESYVNSGMEPFWKSVTPRADTDWQDVIFRRGIVHSHSLGVRGSSNNIRYYLAAGYDKQDGTIVNTTYRRYSVKSNVEVDVHKNLTVGINLNYINRNYADVNMSNNNGVLPSAVRQVPTVPAYNEDGSYGFQAVLNEGDNMNPLNSADITKGVNNSYRTLIHIFGEYRILPSLRFRSNFSGDLENRDYSNFRPTFAQGPQRNTIATLSESNSKSANISFENFLTFDQTFNDTHHVTAMVGQSLITYDTRNISASKRGFPSNEPYLQYFSAGTEQDQVSGGRSDWALLSYFGRLNYSFANKYLFQFNMRADGSSRFGKNNKWGNFPSAAIGWRLSEEQFLKEVEWLSNLKLKGSYGILGTMPTSYYGFTSTLSTTKITMGADQNPVIGYYPASVENHDFKWETIYQTNVGFDIGLWNNKASFSIEYYDKYTKDILQVLPLPGYTGTAGSLTNIGEMKNTGIEFSVGINNRIGDLNYSVNGNLSTLKNEVIKLFDNDAPISSGVCRTEVGRSIGEFYGYVTDGIFQNQAEIDAHKVQPLAVPGDIRFKNLNNDDKLNSEDMTFIGNPVPSLTYGANIGLEYRGIDCSLSLTGVNGNSLYYFQKNYLMNGGFPYNKLSAILDRWQKEGDQTNVPRVSTNSQNDNFRTSDFYVESGSYLRLSNLQLGYTLPVSLTEKIGIRRSRFYISANNLYTFTKYSGFDPEITIDNPINGGYDLSAYPVPRTVLFGLSLTF